MSKLCTALACGLLIGTAASASPVPNFPETMLYRDVRPKLMRMGWLPYKVPGSECTMDACRGFPEVLYCAGVGRAPCIYVWKRGRLLLEVRAIGEGDQTFSDSTACHAIRKVPMPIGGWECT